MKYANYKANLSVLRQAPEQDLQNEGRLDAATGSPRGIIKAAYDAYDFIGEGIWLRMLDDRNAAEHVYDAALARRLVDDIIGSYIAVFDDLLANLERLYPAELLETF